MQYLLNHQSTSISKMFYIHLLNTELFMDFLRQLHLCLQAVIDLNNTIDILKLQARWNGKMNPDEQAHLGLPDNTVRYKWEMFQILFHRFFN